MERVCKTYDITRSACIGRSKMSLNTVSLKEAVSDTALGTVINFPLNYVMVLFCFWMEMTALVMTIFMTSVLFVFAVIRKYYVRIYFDKKNDLRFHRHSS